MPTLSTLLLERHPGLIAYSCRVLVDINNVLIPGFDEGTLRQLGQGSFPGLSVKMTLFTALYYQPFVRLSFSIRHLDADTGFTIVTVPLGGLRTPPTLQEVACTDREAMAALYTHIPPCFKILRGSQSFQKTLGDEGCEDIEALNPTHLADHIAMTTGKIYALRMHFGKDGCRIRHLTPSFDRTLECQNEEAQQIASQARSQLDQCAQASVTIWTSDAEFGRLWERAIESFGSTLDPYSPLVLKTEGAVDNLTYSNITTANIYRPKEPISKTTAFINKDQPTVALIMGAKEEQEMFEERARELSRQTPQATVIQDPFSAWTLRSRDMVVYGIKADGQALHQYLVLDADGLGDVLPDVFQKCLFKINGHARLRPFPRGLTKEQIRQGAIYLQKQLKKRMLEAESNDGPPRLQDKLRIARQEGDAEMLRDLEEQLHKHRIELYIKEASSFFQYYLIPCNMSVQSEFPNLSTAEVRKISAQRWAEELRPEDGEEENSYLERLVSWYKEYGPQIPPPIEGLVEGWPGVRLPLPHDTKANIALFSVNTPTQKVWDPKFKNPPVECKLPAVQVDGLLSAFLRKLKTPENSAPAYKTVRVRILYTPRDTTAKAECNAVTELNKMNLDKAAARFWRYSLTFEEHYYEERNLLREFPQLQRDFDQPKYTEDRHNALKAFQTAPFGFLFGGGGPGSGKTTFVTEIVKSVISAPRLLPPSLRNHTSCENPPERPKASEGTETASKSKADAKVAWLAPHNKLVEDAVIRLQRECIGKIIRRMLPWNTELNNVMAAEPQEPSLININYSRATTSAHRKLAKHSNGAKLRHHKELSPNHCLGSMSEYAKQLAENSSDWEKYKQAMILRKNDEAAFNRDKDEYQQIGRDLLVYAINSCDVICSTPVSIFEMACNAPWKPDLVILDEAARMSETLSCIPMATFPNAAFIFIGDPKQLAPVALAREDKNFKDIFGPQRTLSLFSRVEALGKRDFFLDGNYRAHGTVADWAAEYFYEGKMKIINKTITKMTQDMIEWIQKITMNQSIHTQTLFIGIPESFEYKEGVSFANAVNAHFIRDFIVYLYREAPILNTVDFLRRQNGEDIRRRKGTVLVVVPYIAQKHKVQEALSSLSPFEVPRDLIEVRTIDTSPSHEADVVIADLTRTRNLNFGDQDGRLTVMMTRARLACFIVGHTDLASTKCPNLKNLYTWLKKRGAVLSLRDDEDRPRWSKYCNRCCQHGHTFSECDTKLECEWCAEHTDEPSGHALRHCESYPDRFTAPIYCDEEYPYDDGVERNPVENTSLAKRRM